MTIDPRILTIAKQNLTEGQYAVWTATLQGHSFRGIAASLDLPRTTVTDRHDAAWRTLRKHGIIATPDGRPHLADRKPA